MAGSGTGKLHVVASTCFHPSMASQYPSERQLPLAFPMARRDRDAVDDFTLIVEFCVR